MSPHTVTLLPWSHFFAQPWRTAKSFCHLSSPTNPGLRHRSAHLPRFRACRAQHASTKGQSSKTWQIDSTASKAVPKTSGTDDAYRPLVDQEPARRLKYRRDFEKQGQSSPGISRSRGFSRTGDDTKSTRGPTAAREANQRQLSGGLRSSPSVLLYGSDSARREFLAGLRRGEQTMTAEDCNDILSNLSRRRRTRDALALVRIWEKKPFSDLLASVNAVKTFTIMIDVCGKSRQLARCFSLFHSMRRAGVEPNLITYNTLISACARSNEPDLAYEVFTDMKESGLVPDKFSYGSLIDSCAKSGQVDRAFQIANAMDKNKIKKDQTIYSALMDACGRAQQLDRAFMVYEDMKRNGVWPNLITFAVLIDTCANVREPERAFQLFSEIKHWGFPRANVVVYTALIDACSKAGWPARGELVMKSMIESGIDPNEISYGALLEGWTRGGHMKQAFGIFERMVREHNLRPNAVLLSTLIDACRRYREITRVKDIWRIVVNHNVRPSRAYYPCLICMASQNGDLEVAAAITLHAFARGCLRRVALNSESPTLNALACAIAYLKYAIEHNSPYGEKVRDQHLDHLRVVFNSTAMAPKDMEAISPESAYEHCMAWNIAEAQAQSPGFQDQRASQKLLFRKDSTTV